MALETRTIDIPLTGSLDEKAGDVSVEAPQFARLRDVRVDQRGQIDQRRPAVELTNAGDPDTAHALATHRDDLILRSTTENVWRYSTHKGAWYECASIASGSEPHPCTPCDVDVRTVAQAAVGAVVPQSAISSADVECQGWIDNGNVYVQIVDAEGVQILAPTELTQGGVTSFTGLRVLSVGTYFMATALADTGVVYAWAASNTSSAPTFGSATSLANTVSKYDAVSNTSRDELTIVSANSGTGAVTLATFSELLVAGTTATPAGAVCVDCIGLAYDEDEEILLAMYSDTGAALYCTEYNAGLTVQHFGHRIVAALVGTTCRVPTAVVNGTSWKIAWTELYATNYQTRTRDMTFTGTASNGATYYSVTLMGRAFVKDSQVYLPCYSYGGGVLSVALTQWQFMICQLYGAAASEKLGCVARASVDRPAANITTAILTAPLPDFSADSTGAKLSMLMGQASPPRSGNISIVYPAVQRVQVTFPGESRRFVEYDGVTYFGGGQLWAFDGVRVQESTPQYFPRVPTVVSTPAGGDLGAGTYSWKAVYEWEDSAGALHRSAPSASVSAAAAANDYATINVPRLDVRTMDGTNAPSYRVALYRTVVNGSVYFLESSTDASTLAAGATTNMLAITSTIADSLLGAQLYTTGGIVEPIAPPSVRDLCLGKGRVFLACGDRRNEVWYSKPLERSVSPEFNSALAIDIPGGNVEAVEVLDEKLVVFTDRAIYAVFGDGPNAAGQGGFSEPQLVSAETGCRSRNSVLATSQGIWFQGDRGIMLLDRGMQVQFAGAPVQDTIAPNGSSTTLVTSATLAEDAEEVRFTTGNGIAVYNTGTGQWYTWSGLNTPNHAVAWVDGDGSRRWVFVDATAYAGQVLELSTSGSVYGDTHQGASGGNEMSVITGHLRLAGTGGTQRVRRILVTAKRTGTCSLVVKAGIDYATPSTIATIASASMSTTVPRTFSIVVPAQKCSTIQVQIESSGVATNAGTVTLYGLALEVGVKSGEAKVPAAQKG